MGLHYRVGQFLRILTADSLPEPMVNEIASVLSKSEMALFCLMENHDRWHGYRVLDTLRTAGHTMPQLQAAALLHDVGKTRFRLSLWDRSLIVLVQKLNPGLARKWGRAEANGWKRPFVVKSKHPAWGAEMAQTAASQPLTVTLIRRHQDTLDPSDSSPENELLRLLQWADNQH